MTHVRILLPCYERPELATMLAINAETHDLRDHNIEWSIDPKHGIYPTAHACNHGIAHALEDTPSTFASKGARSTAVTHVLIWGADNYPLSVGAVRALLDARRDIVGSTIACKSESLRLGYQPFSDSIVREGDCVLVKRCGSGFMLIARHVLEVLSSRARAFRAHYPGDSDRLLREVFRDEPQRASDGVLDWTPEDYYFCDRARDAGFQIWMNVSITHGHIGKKDYRGRLA